MSYALSFGAAPSASCRVDPAGWLSPALLPSILASAAAPYWNLPVPAPYETQILNWLLHYAYVDQNKAGACELAMVGDVSVYDPKAWSGWFEGACQAAGQAALCQSVSAQANRFSLPFATWLEGAAARANGVVLATRPDPRGQWDVRSAVFIAPTIDDGPLAPILGALPDALQAPARAYLAATAAILSAKAGQFGRARDLFVVYAPSIANLGGLRGIGQFTLPPLPTFNITYPDGRGGQITIGTSQPIAARPAGAPALKQPGLPSEGLRQWVPIVSAGVGIVVAATTLYFMTRKKPASMEERGKS